MTDFPLRRNLSIVEKLTQDEVDDLFDANFGFQFKGITYRRPAGGKYIILMANEGEIYNDEIGSGSEFIYEGEGEPEKGDQKMINANKELKNAITEPIPVYFFESEEGLDEYEYQGLVDVLDCRYVSDGERMVYRYDVRKLDVATWEEVQETENEITNDPGEEPALEEDDPTYTDSKARARSAVFSRKVKKLYDYTCAVCGARRFSPTQTPEVEAAHIYPKSENGTDHPRNGIALCRFHHWAFDSGWIAVSDDHEIILNEGEDVDPPDELSSLEGNSLREPEESQKSPHPKFRRAHRQLHGFE